MFTGIVQDIGAITDIVKSGDWTITIKPAKLPLAQLQTGASVACAGICLTVIDKTADAFRVQVSAETLDKTTVARWRPAARVNLEPALRIGDELGGHLVAGHIDGVATVAAKHKDGDSIRLQFEAPPELGRFFAPKGSVAIDGVSLTVNEAEAARFGVNIIPHTQTATTLGALSAGDKVNIEIDMIARYAERLSSAR